MSAAASGRLKHRMIIVQLNFGEWRAAMPHYELRDDIRRGERMTATNSQSIP